MNKKTFFISAVAAFSLSILSILPVAAEEINTGTVNADDESESFAEVETTSLEPEDPAAASESSEDCFTDTDGTIVCTSLTENELEEGTSGEAEVVCADPSEPDCVPDGDGAELDEETATWPMVISLAALGATVLFVIIINLIGHRKKQ